MNIRRINHLRYLHNEASGFQKRIYSLPQKRVRLLIQRTFSVPQKLFVVYFTLLSVSILSNDRMIDEWWIRVYLEGSSRGRIEVLSQNLPGGTEVIYKNFSQVSRSPGRYSNRSSCKYKYKATPLYQSVRCIRDDDSGWKQLCRRV
jgi:hypothetical protein